MADKEAIGTVQKVYRICEAGEQGFRAVAENVTNRGLKMLLKTYAEQRRQMAEELKTELRRLGGGMPNSRSYRGAVHRGRIAIMAALTIRRNNVENVVLREAAVGERVALQVYRNALSKNLPAETKALLARQYEAVKDASEKVNHLRGRDNERLVVRLYDTDTDLENALAALRQSGFDEQTIEVVDLKEAAQVYAGSSTSTTEAVASGAVGGAIWGVLLGALMGASSFIPSLELMDTVTPLAIWLAITFSGLFSGALIGAILGGFIGMGIVEEDAYLYESGLRDGNHLVMVRTSSKQAAVASNTMYGVNVAARSQRGVNVGLAQK